MLASVPIFCMKQLIVNELDSVFVETNRPCTSEDLTKLKYLEYCIKETLRLYTTIPVTLRQLTQDLEIGKLFFINHRLYYGGRNIKYSKILLKNVYIRYFYKVATLFQLVLLLRYFYLEYITIPKSGPTQKFLIRNDSFRITASAVIRAPLSHSVLALATVLVWAHILV